MLLKISVKSHYKWRVWLFWVGGRGKGTISIIIGKQIKMLCSKYQQNRNVNEEFDFFEWDKEGGGGKRTLFINPTTNDIPSDIR